MKKFLLFISSVAICLSVYADGTKTCKVKGTDGSVEVSVTVTDESKGICIVSFSNDTDKNVNVRYVISSNNRQLPGSILVYANSEATRQVSFNQETNASSVRIYSLTGEKCE